MFKLKRKIIFYIFILIVLVNHTNIFAAGLGDAIDSSIQASKEAETHGGGYNYPDRTKQFYPYHPDYDKSSTITSETETSESKKYEEESKTEIKETETETHGGGYNHTRDNLYYPYQPDYDKYNVITPDTSSAIGGGGGASGVGSKRDDSSEESSSSGSSSSGKSVGSSGQNTVKSQDQINAEIIAQKQAEMALQESIKVDQQKEVGKRIAEMQEAVNIANQEAAIQESIKQESIRESIEESRQKQSKGKVPNLPENVQLKEIPTESSITTDIENTTKEEILKETESIKLEEKATLSEIPRKITPSEIIRKATYSEILKKVTPSEVLNKEINEYKEKIEKQDKEINELKNEIEKLNQIIENINGSEDHSDLEKTKDIKNDGNFIGKIGSFFRKLFIK